MATGPWLRLYALVAVPLCVLYVALPDPPRYLWTAIGLLSLAGLVVGTVVNNPRRRLPWWLATAGVSSFDWFISISLVPLSYALTARRPPPGESGRRS